MQKYYFFFHYQNLDYQKFDNQGFDNGAFQSIVIYFITKMVDCSF